MSFRSFLLRGVLAMSAMVFSPFLGELEAQDPANSAKGMSAPTTYQSHGLDTVNTFNGALTLRIPLGQEYRVGGDLSYQFVAYANDDIWRYRVLNGETEAFLEEGQTLGAGWRLSFGELLPPISFPPAGSIRNDCGCWVLIEADGSRHRFYDTLHPEDPDLDPDVYYSRDGTYLRLKDLNGTLTVESGNGVSRDFYLAWNNQYRPTRIYDQHGNALNITYGPTIWEFADGFRTHYLYLRTSSSGNVIAYRLELAKFGGGRAKIYFDYSENQPVANVVSGTENIDVLKSIRLPEAGLAGGAGSYGMVYHRFTSLPQNPIVTDCSSEEVPPVFAIRRLNLPTGGGIGWEYKLRFFNAPDPPEGIGLSGRRGVECRMTYNDGASSPEGIWRHEQFPEGVAAATSPEVRTEITDPLGHKTVNYFWNSFDDWRHGLPMSPSQSLAGLPLSREVFAAGDPETQRSFYVDYDKDTLEYDPSGDLIRSNNKRVRAARTQYHDDMLGSGAEVYASSTGSNFDGLGHYRTMTTGGNFNAGNVRTSTTNYEHACTRGAGACAQRGSYPGSFKQIPVLEPWLTGTFTQTQVAEGGYTDVTEACFNRSTGFLERVRRQAGVSHGASDVIERYVPDADGNVLSESSYGGDVQAVATNAHVCDISLPTPQYTLSHGYQFGSLKTTAYLGAPFYLVNRTIDQSTGLPSRDLDTADVFTDYLYDDLGRLTWTRPQEMGWTKVEYDTLTADGTNRIATKQYNNGGTTLLAESRSDLDGLGRLQYEYVKDASSVFRRRKRTYDAAGHLSTLSNWGHLGQVTRYDFYDPFGRLGRIRPADNQETQITRTFFVYNGDRRRRTETRIATDYDPATGPQVKPVYRHHWFDRQGRLWRVLEKSKGDTSGWVDWRYTYDAGNRLRIAKTVNQNPNQTRLFNYDGRGFLLNERHPEKGGTSGNGYVYYYNYDARGNPKRIVDGPNDLRYTYDVAERLSLLQELGPSGLRNLKSFTYAPANSGTDKKKGKLYRSVRWNYVRGVSFEDLVFPVSQTFVYSGIQGSLSQRTTVLENGQPDRPTFSQSWTYDHLGNIKSIGYPAYTDPAGAGIYPPLTVSYQYSNGFLTSIPGFASQISYHTNLALASVSFTNGRTQFWDKDPDGYQRPYRIRTTGGTRNWDSGVYDYDGAGNVMSMGADWYTYDHANRLEEAATTWYVNDTQGQKVQDYTYDLYGNLTSIATAGEGTQTIPVNSTTNRLSGVSYDTAGRQQAALGGAQQYRWDGLGMLSESQDVQGSRWEYIYDADDERFWSVNAGNPSYLEGYWTLRDLDGSVLTAYKTFAATGQRFPHKRYVYREGKLLAEAQQYGIANNNLSFHIDHLGTPRAHANSAGSVRSSYFPFGEEAPSDPDFEWQRFTGHWRDNPAVDQVSEGLDNMHARMYSSVFGRFLSVDPISGGLNLPQRWNRYSYVHNNPMNFTDPTGLLGVSDPDDPFTMTICVSASGGRCGGSSLPVGLLTYGPLQFGTPPIGGDYLPPGLSFREAISYLTAIGQGGDFTSPYAQRLQGVSSIADGIAALEFGVVQASLLGLQMIAPPLAAARLGVSSSGVGSAQASVVRAIGHGEKVANIVGEVKALTFATGMEHAVVSLRTGGRVLVSGGEGGISFGSLPVKRILGHSHPYQLLATGPSGADVRALQFLGQRSSYLLEHGSLFRFWVP